MITPPYYGGEPRNLGLVAPLSQTSFANLVKEVLAHPVPLPLTRAEFWALPEKDNTAPRDRQRTKRTRFVIPGVIHGTTERRAGNVSACNLVFIDIDDSEAAAGILDQLEQMTNVLAPFSFAIYHTASSTPNTPRLRVVVEADNIPPEQYPAAVSTVARMLGLSEVTSESNVVCQPMFVPVIFRNETENPLIAENLSGRALAVEDIDGASLPTQPRRSSGATAGIDLDHLRARVEEITADDARTALGHLNPDMDRKEWVSVGAMLKHQFGDDGLELWREWSAKGNKFCGDEEIEVQWRSLRPTPRGRLPVTIRSLLKMATEAGWSSESVVQKCYASVNAWLAATERTETELMNHGAKRIAAAPMLSHVERGALLNRLVAELKKRGVSITRTDLNRQFRAVEMEARGKGGDDKEAPKSLVPAWARDIIYVAARNEFYRSATGEKWSVESFNNYFMKELLPPGEPEGDARPPVLPQHYLLNVLQCQRVADYIYDPTCPGRMDVVHGKCTYANIYRETYVTEDYLRSDEAGALVMAHCAEMFNTEQEARHVLDWISFIVQNSGGKALWAVLLQGAEGCGKSFFFEVLRRCLGHSNVKEVPAHTVMDSNWTEWAAETQAVNIPEIRVVGESRHAIMNKLKTLISDKTISIDQRNRDTRSVPNYANYFLTTNHTDALALTENDRRYYVVFSKIQTKQRVRELQASGHFQRLFEMLENNPGGLRAWFKTRSISENFNPVIAPESRYKAEMLDAAASPLQRAVETVIRDSDTALVQSDFVSATALRDVVEQNFRGIGRFTDQALASVLREMNYLSIGRIRIRDTRHSVWSRTNMSIEEATSIALRREKGDFSPAEDLL